MAKKNDQWRGALAIAKASLFAQLRSPTSLVFALLFPIVFIVVFGAMVDNSAVRINIGVDPAADTSSVVGKAILSAPILHPVYIKEEETLLAELKKGRIAGILQISRDSSSISRSPARTSGLPPYKVQLVVSNSTADKWPLLQSVIKESIDRMNERLLPPKPTLAPMEIRAIPGRAYHTIDFILPGQMGFSLLMAGVFGSAFLLFGLRQSLVLKRFAATPLRRSWLIFGELVSRLLFQVIGFIIMVTIGTTVFGFTLADGLLTFFEMLLLSIPGIVVFTGMGFIISGSVQNESSVAPIANTITLPQILLCGLFFPVENYPHWLQTFCRSLPLTFFVDGLRKIAFEGEHIWQIPRELGGLLVWAVLVGVAAIRAFRWE
ncbi:MAG: ABC transporter permease [Bacteroidota bacterium]